MTDRDLVEGVFIALLCALGISVLAVTVFQTLLLCHLRKKHSGLWRSLGSPGYWIGTWSAGTHAAYRDLVWKRTGRFPFPDERTRHLATAHSVLALACLGVFGVLVAVFLFVRLSNR